VQHTFIFFYLATDNSCQYHGDGECDEPQYCAYGTDFSDCSTSSCAIVTIGSGPVIGQTFSAPPGYECPSTVSRDNWVGGDTYPDVYAVTQQETSLSVVRTDNGDTNSGWGMNLQFECCQYNCASHSACSVGNYCDSTRHCWECSSLNTHSGSQGGGWCDPIGCPDGNSCPACCAQVDLHAHCDGFPHFAAMCPPAAVTAGNAGHCNLDGTWSTNFGEIQVKGQEGSYLQAWGNLRQITWVDTVTVQGQFVNPGANSGAGRVGLFQWKFQTCDAFTGLWGWEMDSTMDGQWNGQRTSHQAPTAPAPPPPPLPADPCQSHTCDQAHTHCVNRDGSAHCECDIEFEAVVSAASQADVCIPTDPSGIACPDINQWSEAVNAVCPTAAAGRSVPTSCPEICGTVFTPWCEHLAN
jgi:hypothetical protein